MIQRFIRLSEAARLLDRPSSQAVVRWITRYNERNPSRPIRRIHGAVEVESLEAALEIEMDRHRDGGCYQGRAERLRNIKTR